MTLAWVFADERDAQAEAAAEAVVAGGAIVPALWRWEIQNALLVAERRGRISQESVAAALTYLQALPILLEPVGPGLDFSGQMEIARRFDLSVYDAAYVDLALRKKTLIATRDNKLGKAADALKIRWTAAGKKRSAKSQRK